MSNSGLCVSSWFVTLYYFSCRRMARTTLLFCTYVRRCSKGFSKCDFNNWFHGDNHLISQSGRTPPYFSFPFMLRFLHYVIKTYANGLIFERMISNICFYHSGILRVPVWQTSKAIRRCLCKLREVILEILSNCKI